MAKENNLLGIEKFEMGVYVAPANNTADFMSGAFTEFPDIEINSVSKEGQSAEENTIPTEANDSYITLNATVTPSKLKIRVYGVDLSDYPLLMGGTFSVDKWSEPKVKPNIFLSVRLTGTSIDGFKRVVEIPYGKINAKESGSIGKDKLMAIDIEITANTPIAVDVSEGAPLTIQKVAV